MCWVRGPLGENFWDLSLLQTLFVLGDRYDILETSEPILKKEWALVKRKKLVFNLGNLFFFMSRFGRFSEASQVWPRPRLGMT